MTYYGILSDTEIIEAVAGKVIEIEPYSLEQVNPTSYDLTLGTQVAVYEKWVDTSQRANGVEDGYFFAKKTGVLDVKKSEDGKVQTFEMDPARGWVLHPGIGYLMHTRERVHTKRFVPVLDGKSTIGRLFVSIHETAGYGDPGFDGQYTLEVTCAHSVRLYPGMRIGQIRFHTIAGVLKRPYDRTGGYTGEQAKGAIPSNLRRLFRDTGVGGEHGKEDQTSKAPG